MTTVNIHHAKTHLSRLLEQVEAGEEVVIARAGKPVAVLSRYVAPKRPIGPPGALVGQGWIADDFDAPVDDLFNEPLEPRDPIQR
jgi:antitoxin (DNA-binding transcriptional repressor) of toxin-antitoxin stability system